jgi:hypothetical protein
MITARPPQAGPFFCRFSRPPVQLKTSLSPGENDCLVAIGMPQQRERGSKLLSLYKRPSDARRSAEWLLLRPKDAHLARGVYSLAICDSSRPPVQLKTSLDPGEN